jgi:alpha-glucosidase (family GH31 glycosyl hydrolase)
MNEIPSHFKLTFESTPNPEAVVKTENARFTVLTPRMIRMEWSPQGQFEDRASQAFWTRSQPKPDFFVRQTDTRLIIETESLVVVYVPDQPFSDQTLWIEMKESDTTWRYGDPDPGNLGGTARTLDGIDGAVPVSPGLISRSGWSLVDDSKSLVFNDVSWLEPRNAPEGQLDLYFLGYGHDYYGCLRDFNRVSGSVPMIPRFVLGNWWSRYWEYSQDELTELMLEFERRGVPLSVCIIDMDWHITQTGNQCSGWTGYTWNSELFPDPDEFLRFLHSKGLKAALNLHPAEGVHSHEEAYPAMCEALGMDPGSGEPVEFDITNPRFVEAYFGILHHPEEARGIDFWWMDWQQGVRTRLSGLDPLWWLNHLHFLDLGRDGKRRSFIFSRWGGLGNHRYPIGFSGDSVVSWASLAFQPYFTATASNVNYGWWSHDIGGHFGGIEDAELYARWVQAGVFMPVLRLHNTKNPYHERRPWGYDAETFEVARAAMQLRHALIPYLYSMAWRFHRENIPPLLPMYYDYPEQEEAYACPNQYMFGSELIAAPFITEKDADTRLSRAVAWLPEGDWYDFFTGAYYAGGGWHARYGTLRDIPVFARAGAIVPQGPTPTGLGVETPKHLVIHAFAGADGSFDLYEDEGNSNDYLEGEYAVTPIRQAWGASRSTLTIGPAEGSTDLLPAARRVDIVLRGYTNPAQVTVTRGGAAVEAAPAYEAGSYSIRLEGIEMAPSDRLEVVVEGLPEGLANRADSRLTICQQMLKHFRMETWTKADLSRRMSQMIEDPAQLGRFVPALTESQVRALLEVITGAGIDITGSTGEALIVLWNNREDAQVSYLFALNRVHEPWRFKDPRPFNSGTLPHFQAFRPKEDFGEGNPAVINLNYYGVFQLDAGD